ncbi:MAG: protein translocase SEC61 complex subunit gamma [Nanoarchaeota archaeon]|nr:protein translocase SEC61 complex subunit gamma [Nanoarchaeota archaeon]MBU1270548.1 protein translocase SEC61 complex subunit gamma [Nanoarchaeota archaeon]MBU1605016.1 protein translocase SEC61 complex subunit gamma [Nanoarchaeota archaeon]MBU2443440.1 protein translocase SEC61 complex subunit gamma [Nanoarchaeota archaeon]
MDFSRFKNYMMHCWRVLRVTKKPDKAEYKTVVKASALGIAVLGFIGFLLHLFNQLLFS